jgi:quercetin dioxygenase-like cupin family protein
MEVATMPHALTLSSLRALTLLSLAGCGAARELANATVDTTAHAQVVLSHQLPALDGDHLAVTIVEVRYGPGGRSAPHRHPCPVVGYILEGSFQSQVEGEAEHTYTAGQSFYEAANAVHLVSANASRERPLRFLASFTCDRATPLSMPVSGQHDRAGSEP